jgi:hypothetical protein
MPTEKPDQNQSDFPKTSNPAQTALHLAGYYRLEQLTKVTEAELLALHGVGPKAIRIQFPAEIAHRSDCRPPRLLCTMEGIFTPIKQRLS